MKIHKKIILLSLYFYSFTSNIQANNNESTYNLYTAATTNNLELAKKSIESGADIHAGTVDGFNLLHFAILTKSQDVAQLLIDCGVDINAEIHYQYEGKTPLKLAMYHADKNMIDLLLQSGVDTFDNELVHDAITYNLNKLAIELITMHENIYSPLWNGDTTLHTAVLMHNFEMIQWLIQENIDVNIYNDYNDSALHLAVNYNIHDAIKILIQHGADINIQNSLGETPLFNAVKNDAYETAELLLELGADATKKDFYDLEPLDEAETNENKEMITLLLKYITQNKN